jgi:hypothetical protein
MNGTETGYEERWAAKLARGCSDTDAERIDALLARVEALRRKRNEV